jgi:hypothetical protein
VTDAIKARWVEALRSGRYQQGTGLLRKDDAYCCLGVLCDLVEPENWERYPSGTYGQRVHDGNNLLPGHIASLTKIDQNSQWDLANMNDRGKTFAEIADHIEAHL